MRRAGLCLIVHLSAAAFLCANSPVALLAFFASALPRAGARCCCATGCCCQTPASRHCPADGAQSCCSAESSEQTTHDRPTAEPVRQPCDSSYPCCPCGPSGCFCCAAKVPCSLTTIAALTQPDPSIDTDLIEQALFVPPPPAHELLQPPRV